MLKLAWGLVKLATFALMILAAGHWLRWEDRTISDHVKTGMARAERELSGDTPAARGLKAAETVGKKGVKTAEELLTSERQKLRDLIRELNSKP